MKNSPTFFNVFNKIVFLILFLNLNFADAHLTAKVLQHSTNRFNDGNHPGRLGVSFGNLEEAFLVYNKHEIFVNLEFSGHLKIGINASAMDTQAPFISLNGPDTICVETGTTFIDPGVTVSDNQYPTNKVVVTIIGTVNTNAKGYYLIVYRATDPDGNFAETSRIVMVGDCILTGIERVEKENILCFPQPSQNQLYVQHNGFLAKNITGVKVINVLGISYDLPIANMEENSLELDLKQLPSGVYFLILGKEGLIKTQKIVVNK